jgi:hypothetical protein
VARAVWSAVQNQLSVNARWRPCFRLGPDKLTLIVEHWSRPSLDGQKCRAMIYLTSNQKKSVYRHFKDPI